jgi:hypothetical protein
MSVVIGGYASVAVLETLFTRLACTGAAVMLEGLTKLEFHRVDAPNVATTTFSPANWERGWLFDTNLELRWKRLRDELVAAHPFRVRLIVDSPQLLTALDLAGWQTPTGETAQPVQIEPLYNSATYLWGEYDEESDAIPVWYEKIIPRTFAYPVEDEPRHVKIRTAYYALPKKDSEATLHRYIDIVGSEV